MDKIFRIAVMFLLVGIFGMLIAIYLRIPEAPPTFADMRNSDAKSRLSILAKRPLVWVAGSVTVDGNVTVDGQVDVGNTPLEVEVVR